MSTSLGVKQILQVSVTSAANAGDVALATVTAQPCLIETITVKADTASQTDLTSAAVKGGASKVITFLSSGIASVANLTAVDQQVTNETVIDLGVAKEIIMELVGTGATPVDLTVTIGYRACVAGGYLI